MAELVATPGEDKVPVPKPRRRKGPTAKPKCSTGSDRNDNSRSESAKPQRPAVPPRPRLIDYKLKKNVSAPPRNTTCTKERNKTSTFEVDNERKASMTLHQSKSDCDLRHISNSRVSGSQSSDTKQRQSICNNASSMPLKNGVLTPISRVGVGKLNQSAKPRPPPRPSIVPANQRTMAVSQPPSRLRNQPTATVRRSSNSSKSPTHSHLHGFTQSLPRRIRSPSNKDTVSYNNDVTQKDSKVHPLGLSDKLLPIERRRSLPKSYCRKNKVHTSGRGGDVSHEVQHRPGRLQPTSNKVSPVAKSLGSPIGSGQKDKNTMPIRRPQPNPRKPPKRPAPPVHKTISRGGSISITRQTSSDYVNDDDNALKETKQLFKNHVYQEVGEWTHPADVNSPSGDSTSESEYPYVVMTSCDALHIYTALSTTDELKDYDVAQSVRTDHDLRIRGSPTDTIQGFSELDSTLNDSGFTCVQRKQHLMVTETGQDDVLVTANRPQLTSESHDRTSAEHVPNREILAEAYQKLEVEGGQLASHLEDKHQQTGYSNLPQYDNLSQNLDEHSPQKLQEGEDRQSTLEQLEDGENLSIHLVGEPSNIQQFKGDRQSVKDLGACKLKSSDGLLSHQLQMEQPKGEDYRSVENREEQSAEHFNSDSNQSAQQLKDKGGKSALSPEDDDQPLQQLGDKQLQSEECSSTQWSGDEVDQLVQQHETEKDQSIQDEVTSEHYPQPHDNQESKHSLNEKYNTSGTVETKEGDVIFHSQLPSEKQRAMMIPLRQVIGIDQVQVNQQLST